MSLSGTCMHVNISSLVFFKIEENKKNSFVERFLSNQLYILAAEKTQEEN